MMVGARSGRLTWARRLVARAGARDLTVFVVPGLEVARALGLDVPGAGLREVTTPRHANVLLLVGQVPEGLARASAVAYAQMSRPRAILAVGEYSTPPLPPPDALVAAEQGALIVGVAAVRRALATHSWALTVPAFDVPEVRPQENEDARGMQHGAMPMDHGSMGHAMTVGSSDPARDHSEMNHAAAGHDAATHGDMGGMQHSQEPDESAMGHQLHAVPGMMMDHDTTARDQTSHSGLDGSEHSMTDPAERRHDALEQRVSSQSTQLPAPQAGLDQSTMTHDAMGHEAGQQGVTASMDQGALISGDAHHMSHGDTGHTSRADMDHTAMRLGQSSNEPEIHHQGHQGHLASAGTGAEHGAAQPHGMRHDVLDDRAISHGDGEQVDVPPTSADSPSHAATMQGDMDHTGMQHAAMDHGGMAHGTMNHSAMGGMMSMEMMTKDLPRSPDGLPMEWVEAPCGPLFRGLPGGLALTVTLDGDTVARAAVTSGTVARGLAATWPGPVATFADRFAGLDPLAPIAYRLLAHRALCAVAGVARDEAAARQAIGVLERERMVSHLNWLALFGNLLGDQWLAGQAAGLHGALLGAQDVAAIARLHGSVRQFIRRIEYTPLLERRLHGIGRVAFNDKATLRGPVARAAGQSADARSDDPLYRALGFVPVLRSGGDVLARMQVRLADLLQAMDLVLAAGTLAIPVPPSPAPHEGRGVATLEMPRGQATLRLTVSHNMVREALLDVPSTHHVALIPAACAGQELADALLTVASLDLSPWEMDQ